MRSEKVRSGRNWNQFSRDFMSWLSTSLRKIKLNKQVMLGTMSNTSVFFFFFLFCFLFFFCFVFFFWWGVHSRTNKFAGKCPIWSEFEPIRDIMPVLVACKFTFDEGPIKNEGAIILTKFPWLYAYGSFWLKSQSVLIQSVPLFLTPLILHILASWLWWYILVFRCGWWTTTHGRTREAG